MVLTVPTNKNSINLLNFRGLRDIRFKTGTAHQKPRRKAVLLRLSVVCDPQRILTKADAPHIHIRRGQVFHIYLLVSYLELNNSQTYTAYLFGPKSRVLFIKSSLKISGADLAALKFHTCPVKQ